MERLGSLLARRPGDGQDQEPIKAAAIVSAANAVLQQNLKLTEIEVRAVAFRQQELIIRVSHGAVSGQMMMQQEKLLTAINQAVRRLYPNQPPITRLLTRVS